MKGNITKDYSAYKLTTNASVQDLAFVFGEGVADEKYVMNDLIASVPVNMMAVI